MEIKIRKILYWTAYLIVVALWLLILPVFLISIFVENIIAIIIILIIWTSCYYFLPILFERIDDMLFIEEQNQLIFKQNERTGFARHPFLEKGGKRKRC